MNKRFIMILIIISLTAVIILSLFMMSKNRKNIPQAENEKNEIEISEVILDECTDEYEYEHSLEKDAIEEANANEEEKVSPKTIIIFNKYYMGCEHTISRYEKAGEELVNFTKEEFQEKYKEWTIEKFSSQEIVLRKEFKGQCGEHYMLRDEDGRVVVYTLEENGDETLLEKTEIPTEYLTETDMINMENGLIVYGKESLNQLLEDFE